MLKTALTNIPKGKVTRDVVIDWLTQNAGYSKDRYGHFQKSVDGKTYRYKLSSVMARFEVKVLGSDGSDWVRLRSGYYSNLSINEVGQLSSMSR